MIINLTNNTDTIVTINDLGRININPGSTIDIALTKSLGDISNSNDLVELIGNGSIVVSNSINTFSKTTAIQYVSLHNVLNEPRDRSGKLRVHQTSRKFGTMIVWSGEGDDSDNPLVVGGGAKLAFAYKAGQTDPLVKYIDYNMVENETWLHEGYVTWEDAQLDTLDLQVVPRVTSTISGTSYGVYNGYLIVPTNPGEGSIDITSDITQHDGGLVYMPPNDLGVRSTAFWNAEWDTNTKTYTNISPAPLGDGEYNMFSNEIVIAQFVRKMTLIGSGFIALNSSDTDQLGHGMRLKMIADTNTEDYTDHDWRIACMMCLHREKSVTGSVL
jgi:hypothetical protein